MKTDEAPTTPSSQIDETGGPAARALAEAAKRRHEQQQSGASRPAEIGGRVGLEPVRFGDWENKGIASDF